MTTLMSFYKAILHSVDCAVDHSPDFTIRFKLKAISELITSKSGKILILPTKEVLDANIDWEKYIAFHPACESILGGQSEILNVLLDLINSKVYRVTIDTAATIVTLAQKEELRGSLSLAQSELTSMFTFNKAAYTLLGQVAKKNTQFTGEFPLISIRLDRGGDVSGIKYSRICTVVPHFNLYEKTICGCTSGSKSAMTSVKHLFGYLLPDQLVYGTNSKHQPYLMVLLETFYRVALKLNTINKILGKYSDVPQINTTWHDEIDDLQTLYKQGLPQSLAGNLGDPICTKRIEPKMSIKEEYVMPKEVQRSRVIDTSSVDDVPWDDTPVPDEILVKEPPASSNPFGLIFPKNEIPLNARQPTRGHYQEPRRNERNERVEPRRQPPNFNNLMLSEINEYTLRNKPQVSNYGVPPAFDLGAGTLPLGRRRG